MSTPAKLESYLVNLDKALGPISISDKAEIITEIRSHVLETQKHDETQSLDTILASLGEPEQVANRYLLERGLKLQKAPSRPMLKWLTIGFLGSFAIVALFVLILIWQFTPIIKVDDEGGRVVILGGLIDINEKRGHLKNQLLNLTDEFSDEMISERNAGKISIDLEKNPNIEVLFINGKFDIENSGSKTLEWDCEGVNNQNSVLNDQGRIKINFSNYSQVQCSLTIPAGINLIMSGTNGRIDFEEPRYHISLTLTNGKINFAEAADAKYAYDFKLINGKVDNFTSDLSNDAYKIKMDLVNGRIEAD